MSNPSLKMPPRERSLRPLRLRRESTEPMVWQLAAARHPESCRWERVDGRWVSISVCDDSDITKVRVRDSNGRTELADSYEDALAIARRWRSE